MRPLVTGLFFTGLLLLAGSMLFGMVGYDPLPDGGLPWDNGLSRLASDLASTTARMTGILLMICGGFLYALDASGRTDELPAPVADKPTPLDIELSPDADTASRRVRTALLRLNNMPADVVTPEIRIEYDAIRTRHVPDLEAAHAKARRAVVDEKDAAKLDSDYATSLSLIADKLNDLLDDCEEVAGRDLAVQRRFIETRHPPENDGIV